MISAQNTVHGLVMNPVFKHRLAGTVASAKILHSLMLVTDPGDEGECRYRGLNFGRVFLNHAIDVEGLLCRHWYQRQR